MKIFYFCLCTFGFSESSGGFGATSEAFIFSLNNNEELAPFVSKVKPGLTGKAIDRLSYYGPRFGDDVVIDITNRDSGTFGLSLLCSTCSAEQTHSPGRDSVLLT